MSPVAVPSLQHRSADQLDIRRVRRGKGFSYHDAGGSRITDSPTLERIRGIVIPPAWTDVRISDDPDSHLQAVGRDQRGRLQYRYHPEWTTFRDRVKFEHLPAFANTLPAVRKRIDADLVLPGVPRDKVLATVVELLQTTLIRVGNEEYARENGAYGLTTLRNRHATVSGSEIAFVFTGKSGVTHEVHARDKRVAKVLRECQEIRGQRLFQYLDDDGVPTPLHSHDVNEYLRESSGADITAKDFRTWVATVATASALGRIDPPESEREERAVVKEAIERVAADLGNTPTVCRASYVHPRVLEAFPTGALQEVWSTTPPRKARLTLDERRTHALLGRRTRKRAEKEALRRAS
jgi:DNA topoisomerase-1